MEEESQDAAHFPAELSCQGAQLLPLRLQLSSGQSQGRAGKAGMCWTEHLSLVLRKHLWKQNECKRPVLCYRVVSVWLGSSALEGQSTMPFLCLPDSVITCPNFQSWRTQEMRFFGPSWLPLN